MYLRESRENGKDRVQDNRQVILLCTSLALGAVLEFDAFLHTHAYYIKTLKGFTYGPVCVHNSYIKQDQGIAPGSTGVMIYRDPQEQRYSFSSQSGNYPYYRNNIEVGLGQVIENPAKDKDSGFLKEGRFLESLQGTIE